MNSVFAVLRARWDCLPGNLRGGLCILVGGFGMSSALAIAKQLSGEIHAFELNFFRCVFGLLAFVPLFLREGPGLMRTKNVGYLLGRGFFGGLGQVCVYYAVAYLSLAVVVSITFTRPLFLVVLAILFLGERVRWRRWTAILVGFVGVLIVARPDIGRLSLPLIVLLCSTFCHASAHVFLKKSTGVDRPATVVFWYLVISTIVGALPLPWVWTMPTGEQFFWLAVSGVAYLAGQGLLTFAFRAGEATAIMPFDYSRLLYGIGFDIVLFALFPDEWTLLGSGIIIGATLYVVRRQARAGRVKPGTDGTEA